MSNKRYRITLTERQLALVGSAVEPMKCGEEPAPELERVDDETD